jgi:predicted nuclease with TOPRIM domain
LIDINKNNNIASKENEINLMKTFAVEKKQLNEIIHKRNIENEKLKRDYQILEKNMDQIFKEYEDLTNLYNTAVLE